MLCVQLGGPIWTAPIHDLNFVEGVLKEVESCPAGAYNTKNRIRGLLAVISEVLKYSVIFEVVLKDDLVIEWMCHVQGTMTSSLYLPCTWS